MSEIFFTNVVNALRGFIFAFFVMLVVSVYSRRKENEAIGTLFYILIGMSVICLLYMIFLIDGLCQNKFIVNIGLTIDMCMVPMIGSLLLRIVYPGWFNRFKLLLLFAPFAGFVIIHIMTASREVFELMYIYTIMFALVSIFFVVKGSIRYERYLKDNYSEISNKSVAWVRRVVFLFVAWYVVWCLLINLTHPGITSIYYLFMIIIWVELFRRTVRHVIIPRDRRFNPKSSESPTSNGRLTVDIKAYMECERPWLVPTLTLRELAAMLNTNRTYLSEYLNQTLGQSFYDYLNSFRIDYACKILLSNPSKTLFQVADESGFNSISTFRRTFEKHIGLSPTTYRRQNAAGKRP